MKQRGFTLLELMVAISVLTIVALGLAQLLSVSVQINQSSTYTTTAANVARGRLAELRSGFNYEMRTNNTWSDLSIGDHGPETITLPAATENQAAVSFAVSWSVADAGSGRKDVFVSVKPLGIQDPETETPMIGKTVTLQSRFAP